MSLEYKIEVRGGGQGDPRWEITRREMSVHNSAEEYVCTCATPELAHEIAGALINSSKFKTLRVTRDEAEGLVDLLEKDAQGWSNSVAAELRKTFGMKSSDESLPDQR